MNKTKMIKKARQDGKDFLKWQKGETIEGWERKMHLPKKKKTMCERFEAWWIRLTETTFAPKSWAGKDRKVKKETAFEIFKAGFRSGRNV